MKPEAAFEKELAQVAALCRCLYIKIPDMIPTRDRLRASLPEHRKPFDGVLITPNRVYCVECKIDYSKQRDHQKQTEQRIASVNRAAYIVIRKARLKSGISYRVESKTMLFQTANLLDLVKYLK